MNEPLEIALLRDTVRGLQADVETLRRVVEEYFLRLDGSVIGHEDIRQLLTMLDRVPLRQVVP